MSISKYLHRRNNKLSVNLLFVTSLLIMLAGCDLNEPLHSGYTPEAYFSNEHQLLTSLSGVYRASSIGPGMGPPYRLEELSSEQTVVGKIQGWWHSQYYIALQTHDWIPSNPYIEGTWNSYFNVVGKVNSLIPQLKKSDLDASKTKGPIAELRSLRAFAYFHLMDLFGNVPVFTKAKVNPGSLPKQNTRTEVFDFVVKELTEASADLPSATTVGSEYYGRLTKEADYAMLAVIYLNAKIYTGTAQYDKALEYANKVIDSNAYTLASNYFDNFSPDNENSPEIIWAWVMSPNVPGGLGNSYLLKTLPGISGGLFGLPYTPQDGFATTTKILNLFEDQDVRKKMFLGGLGPMLNPINGDTVMVEKVVPDGNSTLYQPGKSTEGPVPYTVVKATGISNQPMNAGIKWVKWQVDPNTNGGSAGNDISVIRYADILLIKAEALLRTGQNESEALSLVNKVRERSNATPLNNLTLQDILDERGRELCFEMVRRRDLIRFGKFTTAPRFVTNHSAYTTIYPIPTGALDANPNLKQNPGYN